MRTDLNPAALDLAARTLEVLEPAFEAQKGEEGEWLQIDATVATALSRELHELSRQTHPDEDSRLWNTFAYVGATVEFDGRCHIGRRLYPFLT